MPSLSVVMPGLVPGIHVFFSALKDGDGRDKPGHDGDYYPRIIVKSIMHPDV
jgi:hypothetical protein